MIIICAQRISFKEQSTNFRRIELGNNFIRSFWFSGEIHFFFKFYLENRKIPYIFQKSGNYSLNKFSLFLYMCSKIQNKVQRSERRVSLSLFLPHRTGVFLYFVNVFLMLVPFYVCIRSCLSKVKPMIMITCTNDICSNA